MPLDTEHDCEVTELPDRLQEVSLKEKPDPDTATFVPGCAQAGLSAIDAPLTTKVAEAESSPGLPDAVIVYVPGVMEVTLNVADNVPLEIEQLKVPTGLPDNEQLVSPVEKSEPVTSTDVPTFAEVGLSLIDGEGTVKLADVKSRS